MMSFKHSGHAFGLRFQGNRELPEMRCGAAPATEADEAIAIDWREARPEPAADPRTVHRLDERGTFELRIPGVAHFEIEPQRIVVHPAPGADERGVRVFLLGSAIGALLQLRGLTVLHGSAVELPDGGAAVFCGRSTAGKSTTAAALMARGYPVLADDLAAVRLTDDGQAWCLPGLARTKLWLDALQALGLADQAHDGTRVLPTHDKHSLALAADNIAQGPVPLRRFFELRPGDGGELAFTPVTGVEKLSVLLSHAYRPEFVQAMGRQGALLRAAAAIAPRLKMHRIVRPRERQTLDAIVVWLERQWAAQPAAAAP